MDKLRNEIRTLHEAYQFLSCKYINHFQKLELAAQEEELPLGQVFNDEMQSGWSLKRPDDIDNAMEAYVYGYSRYEL